jgi:Tfp pilus assembly protein PilE
VNRRRASPGFTAAELLVTTAIAAVVIGAAVMAYSTVMRGQRQYSSGATILIPSGAQDNFYGVNSTSITTVMAPNFGRVARAESLRETFMADTAQAVGVYCLYRGNNTWNTVRPSTITAPPYGTVLDTPEAFRTYLATDFPEAATIFTSYRNYGTTPNISIFILGYSANSTTMPVIAVYDMDFVQATDPVATGTVVGTYASVRRYVGGVLTSYYDVTYPVAAGRTESFTPPVVAFERKSRRAVVEGSTTIDRFKVAAEQPFYFIFWPDPAEDSLALPLNSSTGGTLNGSFATTDPRCAYNHMAGRTAYMFTVPMFPSS